MLVRLFEWILRIRRDTDPNREPVKADPPPWDVPLDQTTAIGYTEGDYLRGRRSLK